MDLVDEENDVAALSDLLHHFLQPLLEFAAVLGAGDERCEVKRVDLFVGQQRRNIRVDDPLRKPLDDGRLAYSRLADQDRVVLRPAREDLHDPLDLGLATNNRVELAFRRQPREVATELVEQLR